MNRVPDIFISYSHRDQKWLDRLCVHLKAIEKEEALASFSDKIIRPGASWRDEIRAAIESAKVAVILVSADLLASEFVREHELPPLLSAAEKRGTVIMPIIVSPSLFDETMDLAQFQSLNSPDQPLIGMTEAEQELVFVQACKAIVGAVRHHKQNDLPQPEDPETGPGESAREEVAAPPDDCGPEDAKPADKKPAEAKTTRRPERTADAPKRRKRGAAVSEETILQFLKQHEGLDSFYIAPDIPELKIQNARPSFGVPKNETVLGLMDCTVFGSAKCGIIFGLKGLYGRNYFASTNPGQFKISYKSLMSQTIERTFTSHEIKISDDIIFNYAGGPDGESAYRILKGICKVLSSDGGKSN